LEKESSKVKTPKSIKGEKEVVNKNLAFAYDSVKINGVKEEVLDTQIVTTT